jgi:thymidylate synthase (FAD)
LSVRLICVSKPVIEEVPGTSELLAYMARVSSTANQQNHETGPKLIRSLVRRKEWSPLEMISLTMEIESTRDIVRQILRHRSFSFQEFSQRYAKVEDEFVMREARLQDQSDRQNSIETDDEKLADAWWGHQQRLAITARETYEWALANGIAKEQARAVLPEGMTPSRLYIAGTLRSWLHYVMLRADPKTQKEHRLIAEQARSILLEQFPEIKEVFE